MNIVVLGFDGCMQSAITGLLDMFALAEHALTRSASPETARPPPQQWRLTTISNDGRPLRDARGRQVMVDAGIGDVSDCDAVLIPGLVPGPDGLPSGTPQQRQAGAWLRARHAHGALIGSSCAGVFVLGEAGLLDARRCTTTWWLQDELKRRFPKAHFIWAAPLLQDQRIVTVGGPLSWVDLALHFIRQLAGADVARLTADFAVADTAPLKQVVYTHKAWVRERDPFLLAAEQVVRAASGPLGADQLAAALATSERTLHRRLKQLAQESPRELIFRVRMETARVLLEGGRNSIHRIAEQCGYADESSFRRAFARFTGMSPNNYRQWARRRAGAA